jgi:thymidine kinase
MFGGKSEELMRRLRRAQIARQNVVVFKPSIDDRYDATDVVSHDGTRLSAVAVGTPGEILRLVGDAEVVGIDEAQFFDEQIVDVVMQLAGMEKRIVVAGLDNDFKNDPFGPMPRLLCIAEFVTKLQAICQVCGDPATRTQRLIEGLPANRNEPVVKVGAAEAYEPRCRSCHELPDGKPELDLTEASLDAAATDGNLHESDVTARGLAPFLAFGIKLGNLGADDLHHAYLPSLSRNSGTLRIYRTCASTRFGGSAGCSWWSSCDGRRDDAQPKSLGSRDPSVRRQHHRGTSTARVVCTSPCVGAIACRSRCCCIG